MHLALPLITIKHFSQVAMYSDEKIICKQHKFFKKYLDAVYVLKTVEISCEQVFLSLSGYVTALIAVAAGRVCGAAGTVNAGGLCGGVVVFVLNAEYHADKPQSFTCNRVNGEVQLESKTASKAFYATPLSFSRDHGKRSTLCSHFSLGEDCVVSGCSTSVDSKLRVSPVLNLV